MKLFCVLVMILGSFGSLAYSLETIPKLVVGKTTYNDATVLRLSPSTARITHSDGICTVNAWQFDSTQQRQFGFAPTAVEAERQRLVNNIQPPLGEHDAIIAMAREHSRREELTVLATQRPQLREKLRKIKLLIERGKIMQAKEVGRALLYATPSEQLQAVGLQRFLQEKGRPATMAEFASWSQELKVVAKTLVPDVLPFEASTLNQAEQEFAKLESTLRELDRQFGPEK